MLIGEQAVIEYMELTRCRHFRIYRGAAGPRTTPVFYYEEAGGTPGAVQQFRKWAILMSGYNQPVEYLIVIYPKGKPTGRAAEDDTEGATKDTIRSTFYLVSPTGATVNPVPSQSGPGYPGMMGAIETPEQIRERIRKEVEAEYELDDLQDQLDELKESQNSFQSGLQKMMGYVLPLLEGDPGKAATNAMGFTKAAPPRATHLAGVPEPDIKPDIVSLNNSVSRLLAKDPDFVSHLEKLASVAETKPGLFNQMLTMLDSL